MGQRYNQLDALERKAIGRLLADGQSQARIAEYLQRPPSTISREIRRNSRDTKAWAGGYDGERAQQLTDRRRRRGRSHKLARQPALRNMVRDRLAMGHSPAQIAGRLALEQGRTVISHESIYRFTYFRSAQKDTSWHNLLPRRKHRRGRLGLRGGSPVDKIKRRRPIHERPSEADDRSQPGHWEADLVLFGHQRQALLVTHERSSRLVIITKLDGRSAQPVVDQLVDQLRTLPAPLRRSISFDNGTEFAFHYQLTDKLKVGTFFCDPRSPWQKGGVENAIGRLRRVLPRSTNLNEITQLECERLAGRYNNIPRKCLNFLTPAEVFLNSLKPLHLKRDSIPRPSPG